MGPDRADAWVLQDAWIKEVLRLTFEDEFAASGMDWATQSKTILFNVLIRALQGAEAPLPTFYNWFQDRLASGKPTDPDEIIVLALDNVIASMGLGPYGAPRGTIAFGHSLLGALDPILGSNFSAIHTMPFSERSTYAHCVEYGDDGPVRIESMFPLGESGAFYFNGTFAPTLDPHNFSMVPVYDPFMPRPFPLFD
jgi:penicillin amidase